MKLTVVILTKNEAKHIERALASVEKLSCDCVVVDSGSTDETVTLARAAGASILVNPWVNYSTQLNWALDHLPTGTDWVLRLDADEVVTPMLVEEIRARIPELGAEVDGIFVSRRMKFLGRPIKWGGLFPVRVLRLFRHGRGRCEERWMDEHILVPGQTADFKGEIVDDNLNSLTWWTEKHNSYASREVIDLLNLECKFLEQDTIADLRSGKQAGVKRWLKENLYANLPPGLRAFCYFIYRYLFRCGFLDGREGVAFHVLQGFWYRYLVDIKLHEVRRHMRLNCCSAPAAIKAVLGIDLGKS